MGIKKYFSTPFSQSVSKFFFIGFVFILSFSLMGCVYLRLLKVKKQLFEFDKNFSLWGSPKLVLEFKNPLLFGRDAVFLIGTPPLQVTQTEEGEHYYYEFELIHKSTFTPPLIELTLELKTKKEFLTQIIIPEEFQRVFSRKIIMECLHKAADAKIHELRRKVQADIKLTPSADDQLPDRKKIQGFFGAPYEFDRSGQTETYIYRYRIRKDKNNVPIILRLTFRQDGFLTRVFVTWDKASVDATFIRPPLLKSN